MVAAAVAARLKLIRRQCGELHVAVFEQLLAPDFNAVACIQWSRGGRGHVNAHVCDHGRVARAAAAAHP
eukprot:scaffold112999_cov21-Tisochrysis_lutea.AAC.2